MKRLLTKWLTRRRRPINLVDPAEQPEPHPASNDGCAITYLSRELTELQGLAERQFAISQRAVGSVEAALELAVEAWQEREDLRGRYYEMLRGVLRLLDDCADLLAHDETRRQAILQRFESLLADHRMQRIAVKPGDRFQPEIHRCEKVEQSMAYAEGQVVQVLQAGYELRHSDGRRQVIRPAKVVVSKELIDECSPPEPC